MCYRGTTICFDPHWRHTIGLARPGSPVSNISSHYKDNNLLKEQHERKEVEKQLKEGEWDTIQWG